jgi:O-methyltransferase
MNWLKKNLKFAALIFNTLRVRLLSALLPSECYVQELPEKLLAKDYAQFQKDFKRNRKFLSWTLSDPNRIAMFHLLMRQLEGLSGDMAELGTYQGKAARIFFSYLKQNEKLFIFDTFEGFASEDVQTEKGIGIETKTGHFSNTGIELVNQEITGKKEGDERLVTRKGYFPDTFEGLENTSYKFVHLDADLYNPIKAGLEKFYPRLVSGGYLLVHDYGGEYEGTKKAVDESLSKTKALMIPMYDKVGSALIIKTEA